MDIAAMITALEENNVELLLRMGNAGGGTEWSDGAIHWTIGGSPLDYHNAVVRADLPPAEVDGYILAVCAALDAHGVPGTWHVGPSMRPADLGTRLLAQGFADGGDDIGMALSRADAPPAWPMPAGMTVERVVNAAQLEAWTAVLAQGFGEGEREARWVQSVYAKLGYGDDAPWRHYLGRLNGEPVATATLLIIGEVGGLYFISTAPSQRRRGMGAAITLAALDGAWAAGCRWAVLGASEAGYGLYQRLGFREICRVSLYSWSPPELV